MAFLEILEGLIVAETLAIMLFVIVKFLYYDIPTKRKSISMRIEVFLKYGWFKQSQVFIFIYILSTFLQKIFLLRDPSQGIIYGLYASSNLALIFLSITLLKATSRTFKEWR